MQVTTARKIEDNIAAQTTAQYHIDPKATVHITRILRNMYKDPVKAVVREYIANAVDAHKEYNQSQPIEVHSPTDLAPVFRVRDYGPGLSVDEVSSLLLGFGASSEHKRTSNTQIGGFGIGCKCAFAISDTFTYTSWHKGMKYVWLCQLDQKDMGEAKLISTEHSDEASGIQVDIPVPAGRINFFDRVIYNTIEFIPTPIKIDDKLIKPHTSYTVEISGKLDCVFKDSSWSVVNADSSEAEYVNKSSTRFTSTSAITQNTLIIVMGGICYPVDSSYSEFNIRGKVQSVLDSCRNSGKCIVLTLPIGAVSLAPTRETLQYDEHTRKVLLKLIKAIDSDIQQQAQIKIDKEEHILDASDAAISLQAASMYSFTSTGKNDDPAFVWRGNTIAFSKHLSVSSGPHASGVKVILAARDTRKAKRSRYLVYNAIHSMRMKWSNNYIPDDSKLRVFHMDLVSGTKKKLIGGDAKSNENHENVPQSSVRYVNTTQELLPGNKDVAPIAGVAEGTQEIQKYIFLYKVPVYIVPANVSAYYYSRKYLIGTGGYAPKHHGYALVVQGTDEQREAFFKAYPWLNYDVKELPLTKTAKNSAIKSTKADSNIYRYCKQNGEEEKPSTFWKSVSIDNDDKGLPNYYVRLHRCVPLEDLETVNTMAGRTTAFRRINQELDILNALTSRSNELYAVKANKQVFIPRGVELQAGLRNELENWYKKDALNDYPIHSYQLLIGSSSRYRLFDALGLSKVNSFDVGQKRDSLTGVNDGSELLDFLLKPTTRKYILNVFPSSSYLHTLTTMLANTLQLSESSYEAYKLLTRQVLNVETSNNGSLLTMSKHDRDDFTRFAQPVVDAVNKCFNHYPLLRYLYKIPYNVYESPENEMLNYIRLVDNKVRQTKRKITKKEN